MQPYTSFQISKALGIEYGRLREWVDRQYITPSINRAKGPGSKHLFTRTDIYRIKLLSDLIEKGLSRNKAGMVVQDTPEKADGVLDLLSAKYIICFEGDAPGSLLVMLYPDEEVTFSLFGKTIKGKPGAFDSALVVNLVKVRSVVDKALS